MIRLQIYAVFVQEVEALLLVICKEVMYRQVRLATCAMEENSQEVS